MKTLVIVQPYIPSYRQAFFDGLEKDLEACGIQMRVAAGRPDAAQALRGDTASLSYQKDFIPKRMQLNGRSLDLGGSYRTWSEADAVVLGLVGTSVDLYRAIATRKYSGLKVGVWGHIDSYVNKPNRCDLALERWQMRHSDHVFAYTQGGAEVAKDAGISPQNITTVMNSVDTASLQNARDSLSTDAESVEQFKRKHGLKAARVLAYVGGLDKSKRIPFLVEALDHLWALAPDIKVVVAGKGTDERLLAPAVDRGQVVLIGYADAQMKAILGVIAKAFLMPGRIGLVAVETLLLRRPILTTAWPFHSAELEYLTEGVSKHTAANNSREYAALMLRIAETSTPESQLREEDWKFPSLGGMISRFSTGVQKMMGMK